MFVTVSVYGAEKATAATGKTRESNLLLTAEASVLLLFPVLLAVLVIGEAGHPHSPAAHHTVLRLLLSSGADGNAGHGGGGCLQGGPQGGGGTGVVVGGSPGVGLVYGQAGHAVRCRAERGRQVCRWTLLLLENVFVTD